MPQKVYSVSQINGYIKNMFAQDFVLNRISVSGEVSNCKYHTSGHIYFSLKDATGTISCVMFASARGGLPFRMSNGMQVVVDGRIDVYGRDGKYELYASRIRQDGAGLLYERFLALKQELEDMGMFSPEYKQPIPAYVKTLGVVTARTGAAVHDIINVSRQRSPGIQIILYPAAVQGEGAAESVAEGIKALDALGVDVIIVGRGGGSIEDLWAFNEEVVARAIFDCRTPVISAVGHETDTTIADFVADLRAPTPTAAATYAVPDAMAARERLASCRAMLEKQMHDVISDRRAVLGQLRVRLGYLSPGQTSRQQRRRLLDLEESLRREMSWLLDQKKHTLGMYAVRLRNASPLEKLAQGYACVTDAAGKKVYSIVQASPKDILNIYVSDGLIRAEVIGTQKMTEDGRTVIAEDTGTVTA
ncbi:MAG: exodeoxyribonuclease VII large subunit [Lachnospiraceae bacterium]|nr:exodeoxyribonuclease VII large subunit [Lachnospiraceae bacterium]